MIISVKLMIGALDVRQTTRTIEQLFAKSRCNACRAFGTEPGYDQYEMLGLNILKSIMPSRSA